MDRTEAEPEDHGMPRSPFPERRLPVAAQEDLPMDVGLLKVLASDSRRDILQHLRKRRMTLTELAHALGLKKATVLEHLKKLTDAGLIRRLEDERLWVYYELTHRGGRIVSPSRTRFYLLMSIAAAAALVLGGVTVALLATDVLDSPASSGNARGTDDTAAHASQGPLATGGAGVSVDLRLPEAQAHKARAYLLTAEDADRLRDETGAVAGIPLALDASSGEIARFRSLSSVPPGNYYLYVVGEDGSDNLASLSEVRVPSLAARAPDTLWTGLSGDADLHLARDGQPAEGTLLLVASEGKELPTLPLANGTAKLDAATLDRLVPATYAVQYNPVDSQFWIMLDRTVTVREPLFAVDPLYAIEDQPTTFRVALAQPGDGAPPLAAPRLDDALPAAWEVAPLNASLAATFAPDERGVSAFLLGRLPPTPVEVVPDVRVRVERGSDDLTRLVLSTPTGAPLPEVAVGLGTRVLDLTDADGALAFPTPEDGAHELRLTLPDGTSVARALVFAPDGVAEQPHLVRVRNVTAEERDGRVHARGTLVNEGAATERVTLSLLVDGRTVATARAQAAPGSAVDVRLSAPVRLAPGEHAVRIDAAPLRHAPLQGDASTRGSEATNASVAEGSGSSTNESGMMFLKDSDGGGDAVTLRVAAPPTTRYELVELEERDARGLPSAPAADAAPSAGETSARTPAPSVLWMMALALMLAIATRRRMARR